MAKLSLETDRTIWDLQHQLLEIIDTARTLELSLMEIIMKAQPIVPDPVVNRRLLDNLRQARLGFEEVDLQVEELVSKFDELIRQQRLQRIKHKQKM
jgi:hypothetical protein